MKRNIVYLLIVFVLLGAFATVYYVNSKIDRIVVIDVIQVFNEFGMKKELESRVELELNKYTDQIDSLNSLLELSIEKNDQSRAQVVSNEINMLKAEVQQTYEISNKNINEQVWNRLNPLIKDFSAKNNYRIVIGANGMGSVLYNVEAVDKTKELIIFINTKYETGN